MRLYHLAVAWYILSNLYIMWRTVFWVKAYKNKKFTWIFSIVFCVVYFTLSLVLPIAFFMDESLAHKGLQRFANYFEGAMMYTEMIYVILDIVHIILWITKVTKKPWFSNRKFLTAVGAAVVIIVTGISTYGFIHASELNVMKYSFTISKEAENIDSLRVVLVADTHIGYSIGADRIDEVVDRINEQDADIVLFAGDIFDNTYEGVDDIDRVKEDFLRIKSRYGVYACWGNHDIDERLFSGFSVEKFAYTKRSKEMEEFLKDCNFKVLSDETIIVNNAFYIVGRKDYEKAGDGTNDRESLDTLLQNVDMDKPVFLLEHEPRFLAYDAEMGIDAAFSGHTHDGQIFPLNILGRLIWENPAGHKDIDGMQSIVTSGVGVYGPNMRVGTDADISVIDISFDNKD